MAPEPSTVEEHVTDAEVVDDGNGAPRPTTELEAIVPTGPVSMTPEVSPDDLIKRLEAIKETAEKAMEEGVDYGKIPGTDKPTLLKPGAEKLGVLFKLDIQPRAQLVREGEHLTVFTKATVFDIQTGARLGFGEGACSSRERKYGKRQQKPKCPDCKVEAIFESKKDPEFYCWKKKGGCGHTFKLDDKRITEQETGEIENPDLPDMWNTVIKMAGKRARVDAVLAVTGASAIFTQDVEDQPAAAEAKAKEPPFGAEAGDEFKTQILRATAYLLQHGNGPDQKAALEVLSQIQGECGGYFPRIVGRALAVAGAKLKAISPDLDEDAGVAAEAEQAQTAAESPDLPADTSDFDAPPDSDDDIPF